MTAGNRSLALIFRQTDGPRDAACLGAGDVAGDPADERVVIGFDDDLVVRTNQLEGRIDLTQLFRGDRAGREGQGQREEATFHQDSFKWQVYELIIRTFFLLRNRVVRQLPALVKRSRWKQLSEGEARGIVPAMGWACLLTAKLGIGWLQTGCAAYNSGADSRPTRSGPSWTHWNVYIRQLYVGRPANRGATGGGFPATNLRRRPGLGRYPK